MLVKNRLRQRKLVAKALHGLAALETPARRAIKLRSIPAELFESELLVMKLAAFTSAQLEQRIWKTRICQWRHVISR